MFNCNITTMEIREVPYTDVPRCIAKFLRAGFDVEDIRKIRTGVGTYTLTASRLERLARKES